MVPLLLALAAAPAPILAPNGSWTVAFEESMCLASRKFGSNGEVTLLLRPSPLGDNLEVTFIQHGASDRRVVLEDKAALGIHPSGRRIDATYKAWRSVSQKGRVIILYVEESPLDELTDDSALVLSAPKEPPLGVSLRHLTKLRPVIEDCKAKVLQHWGVNLDEHRSIVQRAEPIGGPASWVSYMDYPAEALRKGQSGVVTLIWTIGADGTVANCRTVASSGVPALDRAGCGAIMRRARYRPALGADGKPVPSYGMRRVMWLSGRS